MQITSYHIENAKLCFYQGLSAIGIIYGLFVLPLYLWFSFLIFGWFLGGVFGHAIGLHRYWAHRSFKVNRFWHYVLCFQSVMCGMGSPATYASVHLRHHKHSDTEKDPHSPKYKGRLPVFLGYFFNIYAVDLAYAKRFLVRFPEQKFIHQHYNKFHILYIALLYFINPILLWPLYFFPVVWAVLFGAIVNVFNHYPEQGVSDKKWIEYLLAGEGWHKQHHHRATATYPYPDFSGTLIKLIGEPKVKYDKNRATL